MSMGIKTEINLLNNPITIDVSEKKAITTTIETPTHFLCAKNFSRSELMKTALLIFSMLLSACGAKTYQESDRSASGIQQVTYRKGVGYENETVVRDSTYEFRSCKRENRNRPDVDMYCRCMTEPEKIGFGCFNYGIYGGNGMVGGGYSNSNIQFPGQINLTDGSTLDPRTQVRQPGTVVAANAPAPQSNGAAVTDPWNKGKAIDPKSDEAPATRGQLKIVVRQVKSVSEQQADLSERVNKVAPSVDDKQTPAAAPKTAAPKTPKKKSSKTEDL